MPHTPHHSTYAQLITHTRTNTWKIVADSRRRRRRWAGFHTRVNKSSARDTCRSVGYGIAVESYSCFYNSLPFSFRQTADPIAHGKLRSAAHCIILSGSTFQNSSIPPFRIVLKPPLSSSSEMSARGAAEDQLNTYKSSLKVSATYVILRSNAFENHCRYTCWFCACARVCVWIGVQLNNATFST